jgi:murein tripeptide amidase MpaA
VQVVTASDHRERDDRWSVSAFAAPEAADRLEGAGLEVRTLQPAEEVRRSWVEAAPVTEDVVARGVEPDGYLTYSAVEAAVRRLADAHQEVCERLELPYPTHEGRRVSCLRIGAGEAEAPGVLVLGGVHAREWAPPDGLVSFAAALLEAYDERAAMRHPEWIDRTVRPPIPYTAWEEPAAEVRRVVEGVRLFIAPLVNPDGRDFSLAPLLPDTPDDELTLHRMWRKNRRPAPDGASDPWCAGVDLNRNFDIAWDYERYYDRDAATQVACSKDACDPQVFIGPDPASEPETRNVQELVDRERIAYFMDVHSFSRRILFPWGMDDDQAEEPEMSFANTTWDRGGPRGGRDGKGGVYGEYLPAEAHARQQVLAEALREAILRSAGPDERAARRSAYEVKQELGLYPTTGNSNDYCFSRPLLDSTRPPAFSFCLECGIDQAPGDPGDAEGGFQPDRYRKFPKIEREVHAAVFALLKAAS